MADPTPMPVDALYAAWRAYRAAEPPARGRITSAFEVAYQAGLAAGRTAAAPNADDPWKDWGRPEPADLDAIERFWLSDCPEHDIGEPERGCNCPQGDYRQVIADLVSEVRALRGDVAEGEKRGRTAAAADIRAHVAEWDSAKNTGAYSKGLHDAARIADRHSCSNCEGVDPASCLFSRAGGDQ